MSQYTVYQQVTCWVKYEIEAESVAEAILKADEASPDEFPADDTYTTYHKNFEVYDEDGTLVLN